MFGLWKTSEETAVKQEVLEGLAIENLILYSKAVCPFCMRVLSVMDELGVEVEVRDSWHERKYIDEVIEGGGRRQFPCLKVEYEGGEKEWIYESRDIIAFLRARYG